MKKTYAGPNEDILIQLKKRTDPKSLRIMKMLELPDLTVKKGSPVFYATERIKQAGVLQGGDLITFPDIVPIEMNFNLLGFPHDHPSRLASDTYYVDAHNVLRTQTTTMWPYYLRDPEIIMKLKETGRVLALSHGKVYRNDEIDRVHYPVFHQIDGLCVCERKARVFTGDDLVQVLVEIAQTVYGPNVKWQVQPDSFPFTDSSIELCIERKGEWLEVLGAGLVRHKVLELLGWDPEKYNGWAFGFGIDRLALIKMEIPDIRVLWSTDERITRQFQSLDSVYREVSKYPATDRDVSFVVGNDVALNSVYEIMRECGSYNDEDIIEEAKLVDTYTDKAKFGPGKTSYSFRIRYRSHVRTLTNAEINEVQERVRLKMVDEFKAVLR